MNIAMIRTINDIKAYQKLYIKSDFKIFGFVLYHSKNKNIHRFFIENRGLLDKISGKNILLFLIQGPRSDESRDFIQEQLNESIETSNYDETKDLKRLFFSRLGSHRPYDPNECFVIAEKIQLPRTKIPCIVFFRKLSKIIDDNALKSFAVLKLNSKRFSGDLMIEIFGDLFDRIDKLIKKKEFDAIPEKEVVRRLKLAIRGIQRKNLLYKPIYDELVSGLEALVKLPFSVLKGLDQIVVEYTKKKLSTANEG